jgi:hypothetical protein
MQSQDATNPTNRIYRCSSCKEVGHNRARCPIFANLNIPQTVRQQLLEGIIYHFFWFLIIFNFLTDFL